MRRKIEHKEAPFIKKFEDTPLSNSLPFEECFNKILATHNEHLKEFPETLRTLVIVRFDRDTKEVRITSTTNALWPHMDQLTDYCPDDEWLMRLSHAFQDLIGRYEVFGVEGGTLPQEEVNITDTNMIYDASEILSMCRFISPIMCIVYAPQDISLKDAYMTPLPTTPLGS